MSAENDDHDDDAALKQLRSVWVSMRDEEPSDRGMAALMAAARTKAAELEQAAQPSWWQRLAASLRRPPVLALATVTVLLGGALVLTQRKDAMKTSATVETDTASTRGYGDGEEMAANGPSAGSAAPAPDPAAAPLPPTEVPPPEPVVTDKVVRDVTKPTKARPANTAPSVTKAEPLDDVRERDDFATPPGTPASGTSAGIAGKPPSTQPPTGGGGPATLSIAQDSDQAPSAAPEPTRTNEVTSAPKKPIGRTPAPSIEGEDRQVTTDSKKARAQQATLDQLVKQCETAAAKGDCPAVRALAQRIFSTSPSVYKSRVASKPAIARCLPTAADDASAAE